MSRTLPDSIIGQDAEKGKDLVPPLQLAAARCYKYYEKIKLRCFGDECFIKSDPRLIVYKLLPRVRCRDSI